MNFDFEISRVDYNHVYVTRALGSDGSTDIRIITVNVIGAGNPNSHAPVFEALSGAVKILEDATAGKGSNETLVSTSKMRSTLKRENLLLQERTNVRNWQWQVANLPPENPICHLLKTWVAKSYYLAILL